MSCSGIGVVSGRPRGIASGRRGGSEAGRTAGSDQLARRCGRPAATQSLLTYFLDVSKPRLQLSSTGASRPGRTGLTVTLPEPGAVSAWMPVVSPRPDGMTHDVVHTWAALKVCV